MKVEIVEGREFHCGRMVRMLRDEHTEAIARLGVNTHRELRRAFDDSSYRRAVMIEDALAALGGVTGPVMASSGTVWLALTQEATQYPLLITRLAIRHLQDILSIKRELTTFILPADKTSLRFAKMLGFATLRNSPVESVEGAMVPMVLRRKRAYTAAQAAMH